MNKVAIKNTAIAALVLGFGITTSEAAPSGLAQSIHEQAANDEAASQSQGKVSKTADQTRELLDEYRLTLRQIDNTKLYNEQLRKIIQSQSDEMISMRQQIQSLKETHKEIVPLMLRMLDALEKFVDLDVPFLPEERKERVANLRKMLDRGDVSTSEKYRRVLEAFQVENDYGRTIEAYSGVRKVGEKELNVDYLRVGRLALIFQTPDRGQSGMWDQQKRAWVDLPSEFDHSVQQGLLIARKQAAPNLIKLPVPAAEVRK